MVSSVFSPFFAILLPHRYRNNQEVAGKLPICPAQKMVFFFTDFWLRYFYTSLQRGFGLISHILCKNCFFVDAATCKDLRGCQIVTHVSHSYTNVNTVTQGRHIIVYEAPCWYPPEPSAPRTLPTRQASAPPSAIPCSGAEGHEGGA
jgi:hypothetical protein